MQEQINPFVMTNEELKQHHIDNRAAHFRPPIWGCPLCIERRGKLYDSDFPPLEANDNETAQSFIAKNKVIAELQEELDSAKEEIEDLEQQIEDARAALGSGFSLRAAVYFEKIHAAKKGQPLSPEDVKVGMMLLDRDVERLLRKVG
jgi:hypothetical protein